MPLTEFAKWTDQRNQAVMDEINHSWFVRKQKEWTEHLANSGVDITELNNREPQSIGDKRTLPFDAWESIYERFSSRHRFYHGRDQLGCDDEEDPATGLRGITVDVYNGITGLLICTVDVGIDIISADPGTQHRSSPITIQNVGQEVERWAVSMLKRGSEGYYEECMRFSLIHKERMTLNCRSPSIFGPSLTDHIDSD